MAYPVDISIHSKTGFLSYLSPMEGVDINDRPLLEGRSIDYEIPDEDYKICPYKDSRKGSEKPMNAGALRIYKLSEDQVITFLTELKNMFHTDQCFENTSNVFVALRVSHAAYNSPKRWLFDDSSNEAVPAHIAAAAKMSHGIYELCLDYCSKNKDKLTKKIKSDDLIEHASHNGNLIGREEVCAAPITLIRRVLGVLLSDAEVHEGSMQNRIDPKVSQIYNHAKLFWQLERVAIIHTYYRFHLLRPYMEGNPFETNIIVSFPNAITVQQAASAGISLDSSLLAAYIEYQETNDSIDIMSKELQTCMRAGIETGNISMDTTQAIMIGILKEIDNRALNQNLAASSKYPIDSNLVELYFGKLTVA